MPDIRIGPPTTAVLNIYFEDQTWTHRFKLDSTTSDVKRILSRKFVKLPTSAFRIHFNDVQSQFGAEVMKFPQRTLRRWGAKDNDEIYVHLTTGHKE